MHKRTHTHTHTLMQAHIIVEASQHARALICSAAFKTTAAIHFRKLKPQSDFNQRHQSTNCSSRSPFLSLSVMAKSVLTCPLLQCLSFFFSPSLCRFTLTYRELILLFLSFNKLLFKRWDPSSCTHTTSPSRVFPFLLLGRFGPGIRGTDDVGHLKDRTCEMAYKEGEKHDNS